MKKLEDQFHHMMSNLHPQLKFEIEKPEIAPNGYYRTVTA